jgi:TatD DNase family protein
MTNDQNFLVDSHCHLNMDDFKNQIDDIISHAQKNNVQYFLTVNTKLEETKDIQKITDQYPTIFGTCGVHPHYAANYDFETLEEKIKSFLDHKKIVALGETGLDYYYNHSPINEQKKVYDLHLKIAKEKNLPVIIHTRDADADTIDILNSYQGLVCGVFHCFSGSMDLAKKALDLGFYISFSGIITFKKAVELQEIVKYVPLDRILVETDSPYLAPIPHRGKRNEPALVKLVAEQISLLKNIQIDTVAKETTKNFFDLFLPDLNKYQIIL